MVASLRPKIHYKWEGSMDEEFVYCSACTRAPDSKTVGFARVRLTTRNRDWPRVFLATLKVKKQFRRRGIGTEIMNLVVEKFGENDEIYLLPEPFGRGDIMEDDELLAFYAKWGFHANHLRGMWRMKGGLWIARPGERKWNKRRKTFKL